MEAKYRLEKGTKASKKKILGHLAANDPTSIWKDLQEITSYELRKTPLILKYCKLSNELRVFSCRF